MFSGVKNSKHKRKCNDIKKRKKRLRSNDKAVYEHQNKKENNKRKKDKLHKGFKDGINIIEKKNSVRTIKKKATKTAQRKQYLYIYYKNIRRGTLC